MIRSGAFLRASSSASRRRPVPGLRSATPSSSAVSAPLSIRPLAQSAGSSVFSHSPHFRPRVSSAVSPSGGIRNLRSRPLSTSSLSDQDLRSRLDEFQDLFVEARLSIEDCADSADTTYFDEEAESAREAVDEAVKCFEALLGELDEEAKGRVMRQNGLKVEQLKGELELVLNGGHSH